MEFLGATSGVQYLPDADLKRQPSLKGRAIRSTIEPIVIEEDEEQDEVDRIYREISELTDSLAGLGLEPAISLSKDIKSTLKSHQSRESVQPDNQCPIRTSVGSESASSEEPTTPQDGALTLRPRSAWATHKKSNSWPLTDAIMEGLSKNSGSSLRRELSIRNPERTLSVSTWPIRHRRSSSIISNISLMDPSPYPAPLRPLPPIPPRRSSHSYASVRRFSQRLTPAGSIDLSANSSTSSLPGSPSISSLRSSTQSYILSSVHSSTQFLTPPALPSPTRSTDSPTLSSFLPSPTQSTFTAPTELTTPPSRASTTHVPSSKSTTKLSATHSSTNLSTHSSTDLTIIPPEPPTRPPRPEVGLDLAVHVIHQRRLSVQEKRKNRSISFIDVSKNGTTIATKQGKNVIRFWNQAHESLTSTIKITSSIEGGARSRDYLARSHVVISEKEKLAAVATRFGRTVEIWNWVNQKKLQTIEHADRWVANRFETFDDGWSPLAIYKEADSAIDLYGAVGNKKKPFAKVRIIDLRRAGLPFLPGYPEIALSTTQPLLIAATGGRVPRPGFPPPERETMLVAWDISDYREVSNAPHLIVRPWLHDQLDMATPCALATHKNIVVSIWIPPSHRVYNELNTETGECEWKLKPAAVALRHVLVWDMNDNTTGTYDIPNTTSCISPDCRFVAYSVSSEERSKLAIVNASTGEEVWCADGIGVLKGLGQGLGQARDLSNITALSFSSDGRLLIVSDSEGNTDVYNVLETVASWVEGEIGQAWAT